MQKYEEVKEFKLLQEPIVKDNIIILQAKDKTNIKYKCVYFPGYRDAKDTAAIKTLEPNKTIYLEGSFKPDRRTKEMQFVISKVSNAYKEQAVIVEAEPSPADISPNIQVVDKLEEDIPFWDRFKIELTDWIQNSLNDYAPNANEYPAPLFDGDPYAIDPSRDFLENIKTYQIGELLFYTDGKMYWLKDHKTLRNKAFITSAIQEQFNRADNPFAEFATH